MGYDGIVIANSRNAPLMELSRKDIFMALAKDVPDPEGGEKLVSNPYKTWQDVDPMLPATKIEVLGPPPTSGTRDAFAELAMEGGCKKFDWIKAIKSESKKAKKAGDKNLATGNIVSRQADPVLEAAAAHFSSLRQTAAAAFVVVVLVLAIGGASLGWRTISPRFRARNRVEAIVKAFLILCSTVAIIQLEVDFSADILGLDGNRGPEALQTADYGGLIKAALRKAFPDVRKRGEKRKLYKLASSGTAYELREMVLDNPSLIGRTLSVWLTADDEVDMLVKGHFDREAQQSERRVSERMIGWVEQLEDRGAVEKRFNVTFFKAGDSREPELAGIWGATVGSFYALVVTLALSFPIGVAAAIYLEEFAPKNRWTDLTRKSPHRICLPPGRTGKPSANSRRPIRA